MLSILLATHFVRGGPGNSDSVISEASSFTDLKNRNGCSLSCRERWIEFSMYWIRSTSYQICQGASLTYHRKGSPSMISCVRCLRILACHFCHLPTRTAATALADSAQASPSHNVRLLRAHAHLYALRHADGLPEKDSVDAECCFLGGED